MVAILHEAKNNEVVKKLPMYNVFVYLNLAVLNFGKGLFKEALKNLKDIAGKGDGSFIHIKTKSGCEVQLLNEIKARSRR